MGATGIRQRLVERWRGSTRLQDGVAAAATFAAGLVFDLVGFTGIWFSPPADRLAGAPGWWHTVPLAVGCLAMLGKRRHPMLALGAGTIAAGADLALGGSIALVLVMFDLIFSVGQFASARARTAVTTAVFVVIGTVTVVGGLATGEFRMSVFLGLQLTTLLFVPLWWAANIRQQRLLGELGAEQSAREAVLAERAAMARDLHDIIAAHLSTTAIHSGAALSRPPETERDRAALRAVRSSSLSALEEMRSMIMLLRADGGPAATDLTVPGGLEQLPELVETATAAGLHVEAHLPAGPGIPMLVAHTIHRIVREALTNALKHAPAAHVRLEVRRSGDEATVRVTNTLTRPDGSGPPPPGSGTGLVSMRERAALLGGRLTAGRDGDTWRVCVTLPLHPADAAATGPTTRRRP